MRIVKDEKFYERLARLRSERKKTVASLAKEIGIAPSTYRAWEYGRAIQGPEPFVRLAKAFDVPLSELMAGRPAKTSALTEKLEQTEALIGEVRRSLLSLG